MKKLNFSAGPSYFEDSIMADMLQFIEKKDGLSFLEISHRSKKVVSFFEETEALISELMGLNQGQKVLFLHGGASLQYCMVAYGVKTKGKANFIDTGVWSSKAIAESSKIRQTNVVASSKDGSYLYIPKEIASLSNNGFLHITTNNTIYGTQYSKIPQTNACLVADMSSDILSRQMDFNQFGLLYAGFQKNLGTAGGCLTVVKPEILDGDMSKVPSMLDYAVHIKNDSMFNTPPVFAVVMCKLTLDWIVRQGGLEVVEQRNNQKAALLYSEIDRNPLFYNKISAEDRSKMNVVFRGLNEETEARFEKFVEENGLTGLKGHRLSGGFRATLYNTLPLQDAQTLVDVMKDFERTF